MRSACPLANLGVMLVVLLQHLDDQLAQPRYLLQPCLGGGGRVPPLTFELSKLQQLAVVYVRRLLQVRPQQIPHLLLGDACGDVLHQHLADEEWFGGREGGSLVAANQNACVHSGHKISWRNIDSAV